MAKLKICGLRRAADVDYVNRLPVDYAGFILSPGFRRSISMETAQALRQRLSPRVQAVGVFVNEAAETVNRFVQAGLVDLVQLHGTESPAYCRQMAAPVIKVFTPDTFDRIAAYDTDFFLFDAGTGVGKTFDWQTLPKTDKPFFLAGGLNAENIPAALQTVKPYAIDLSSAVETDGVKDYDKIKRITECMDYAKR